MEIIPRQPLPGVCFHVVGMTLEGGQVVKRIGAIEPTGMDDAHEEVSHPGTVLRFVTQGVFAVQDGHLQSPFADVMPRQGLCRVAA